MPTRTVSIVQSMKVGTYRTMLPGLARAWPSPHRDALPGARRVRQLACGSDDLATLHPDRLDAL